MWGGSLTGILGAVGTQRYSQHSSGYSPVLTAAPLRYVVSVAGYAAVVFASGALVGSSLGPDLTAVNGLNVDT
jgi:hypothetical protein